jgi:hypothetical protein
MPAPISKPGLLFGLALGVAAGLFVAAFLFTMSVAAFAFSFGMELIVPLGLSLAVGWRLSRQGTFARIGWPHLALLVLLGWPAAVLLPPAVRILRVRSLSRTLPMYPGAQFVERNDSFFDSDSRPAYVDVRGQFPPSAPSADEIHHFYREQLPPQGWRETPCPHNPDADYQPDVCFEKRQLLDPLDTTLSLDIYVRDEDAPPQRSVTAECEVFSAFR